MDDTYCLIASGYNEKSLNLANDLFYEVMKNIGTEEYGCIQCDVPFLKWKLMIIYCFLNSSGFCAMGSMRWGLLNKKLMIWSWNTCSVK